MSALPLLGAVTHPVMVGGAGPYAFIINTGSQATAVTNDVCAFARLASEGTATLVGMASRREMGLVDVGRITSGICSYTNFCGSVVTCDHVGADAIIGLDALQDLRALIDFRLGQLLTTDALADVARAIGQARQSASYRPSF